MKKTKIIHRKLGKEQADGLAYKEAKEIHIDERLTGQDYILTVIHELLHIHLPKFSEKQVDSLSKKLTNDLWNLKIRRVDE
jgi:Zn-dependent peptidase ImmA (M78 family)